MNFNDNKAIYQQIAERIMDEIIAGKYTAGNRIPSVREYAATMEVNANTVMRSYELLERSGIIFNRRGIGFFVDDEAPRIIKEISYATFSIEELPYFFRRLESFGFTPETLSEQYQSYLNNPDK